MKKIIHKILEPLISFLITIDNWSTNTINSQEISNYIRAYYNANDLSYILDTISDISAVEYKDSFKIIITTSRPGSIIGKKGERLDKLGLFIRKKLGKDINLQLEETYL